MLKSYELKSKSSRKCAVIEFSENQNYNKKCAIVESLEN